MPTLIVSDLHLGSPHCQAARFLAFLQGIPDGATLILNGDTIDRSPESLPAEHQAVLDALQSASERLQIIYLEGNHELAARSASPPGPMQREYAIGKQLYIAHGHSFRLFRSYEIRFLPFIKFLMRIAMSLGAPSMHPAAYAKRWPWLYRVLRKRLRANALRHAREHGFAAVTCGHVHYAEDSEAEGIRYLNSGCWTEETTHCLYIEDEIRLIANPDRELAAKLQAGQSESKSCD
jgi:UDP-2,3-diacylglucosamine pyrophosphatase LpxH